MISTAKIRTIVLVLLGAAFTPIFARDVLFLGLTGVRGEPVLPELENEMRAEFSAANRFRLIGDIETQRIIREMERQGRGRAEAVIPKSAKLADSTVIIRGVVKELSVVPKRSPLLLWGKIDAHILLEIRINELAGPSSYRGEFGAAASKRKDIILFQNPQKVVHISAVDREELLGGMWAKLIKDVASLAATFFNSISAGPAKPSANIADSTAAPIGTEFSTVDGDVVQPIDTTAVIDSAATAAASGE